MLIYKSRPEIDDLPLSEIRRFSSLFHINTTYTKKQAETILPEITSFETLLHPHFQLALINIMYNCDKKERQYYRSVIIRRIKELFPEKLHFVSITIDNHQYWLLSNSDDNIEKIVDNGIEYYIINQKELKFYQMDNIWIHQISEFGFGVFSGPRKDYYRIAILYLEAIHYFMMLNATPLDIDILYQIKTKYLSFYHLKMLKNYCMLIDGKFSIAVK